MHRYGVLVVAMALVLALALPGTARAWRNFTTGPIANIAVDGSGNVVVAGYAGVSKLNGATGTSMWTWGWATLTYGTTAAVDADDNGDVAAVHTAYGYPNAQFIVEKRAGSDGNLLWSRTFEPGATGAVISVPGAAGDVIAAGGSTDPLIPGNGFTVLRLSGVDGSTTWAYSVASGTVKAVALDSSGNVIAAGADTVVKLDGATGAEIWSTDITLADFKDVALTSGDDVIAAGSINNDFAVVRLTGADGDEVWRQTRNGNVSSFDEVNQVALDSTGNVFAAGSLWNTSGQDFTVMKIDGSTGAQLWLQQINGSSPPYSSDVASAVTVEAGSGDALVVGTLVDKVGSVQYLNRLHLVRFAAASGSQEWALNIDPQPGTSPQSLPGRTLAQDGAGHLFVGGGVDAYGGVVARLGVDGTPGLVRSSLMLLKDKDGDATKRSALALSTKDPLLKAPDPGSADDPTTAGAVVRIVNPTSGESTSIALPAGMSWKGLGNPAGSKGYLYKDPDGTNGPCSLLLVRPGKLLKVKCSGHNGPINFSLDEPSQGTVTTTVQLGGLQPQCMAFGLSAGTSTGILKDTSTNPGPIGMYKSKGYNFGFPSVYGPLCPP